MKLRWGQSKSLSDTVRPPLRSMIERLRTESISYPEMKIEFRRMKTLFCFESWNKVIENNYMLEIPNCEMGFLMDILTQNDTVNRFEI